MLFVSRRTVDPRSARDAAMYPFMQKSLSTAEVIYFYSIFFYVYYTSNLFRPGFGLQKGHMTSMSLHVTSQIAIIF